jgi:sulfur carrier protein
VEVAGPLAVQALLDRFEFNRESVLVIVDGTLVTGDAWLVEGSTIEVRPVISGGADDGIKR